MKYQLNEKRSITIPEKEIEKIIKGLEVDREEAVKIWLEDNDYEINTEQQELNKKASKVKINHEAYSFDKTKQKTQKERVKKVNENKKNIINALIDFLPDISATEITIVKDEKLITFNYGGKNYKLDLIETREKKE